MKPVVTVPTQAFAGLSQGVRDALKKPFTDLMKRETRAFEKAAEAATASAGLGRLTKTWNSKTYPEGRDSLNAAGLIWSKAPLAMKAFTEGVVIKGKGGGWLAIPTPEVARLRGESRDGGNRRQRITPGGFERATGMKLHFVYTGTRIAFLVASGVRHKNAAKGFRARTAAETRRGRKEESFLAFWLIRQVTIRKRIDLQTLGRAAQARVQAGLPAAVQQAMRDFNRAGGTAPTARAA